METLCQHAADEGITVGLYGGSHVSLSMLRNRLDERFPGLVVSFCASPPFRPLTSTEDADYVQRINSANVQVLFVGIGCPKQERWMAEHRGRVNAVMLGVGAAFDFIAGVNKPSPPFVHRMGFEWLYRLLVEPDRLWKRYFKHNPRFVWYYLQQRLGRRYPA